MPFSVYVDRDSRVVWARGSGRLTRAEIVAGLQLMVSDPAFEPGLPQLCDLREVTDVDLTSDEVRRLAEHAETLGAQLGPGKLAVLSDRPVVYGVSRMYEVFAENIPVEVRTFRDHAEAVAWLGVDPGPERGER